MIHGIPSESRILQEGDIVKIDVGAFYHGFHGDSANTFCVGHVSENALRLIEVTRACFFRGVAQIQPEKRIGDIGAAVEACAAEAGYSVVRKYIGHGVGKELHEAPDVPNYGRSGHGVRLCAGMTIAVEPMVNAGSAEVRELSDGWTVVTADGSLSAHYEHTVAVTNDGVILLTQV